jgi:hypothetical protein
VLAAFPLAVALEPDAALPAELELHAATADTATAAAIATATGLPAAAIPDLLKRFIYLPFLLRTGLPL